MVLFTLANAMNLFQIVISVIVMVLLAIHVEVDFTKQIVEITRSADLAINGQSNAKSVPNKMVAKDAKEDTQLGGTIAGKTYGEENINRKIRINFVW